MPRRAAMAALLALAAATLAGCTTPAGDQGPHATTNEAEARSVYVNPALGYRMAYPATWFLVTRETDADFEARLFPASGRGKVLLTVTPTTSGADALNRIADQVEAKMRETMPEGTLQSLTPATLGGQPALRIHTTVGPGQEGWVTIVTIHGAMAFVLTFEDPAQGDASFAQALDLMLSSFAFTDELARAEAVPF